VRLGEYENCKYGFINKTAKVIIPLKYDGAGNRFINGKINVQLDGELIVFPKGVGHCPKPTIK
tara:strand:+ start:1567 stop:1755 length:189 start_codon:yes stop_codon:yes gene_type:complete